MADEESGWLPKPPPPRPAAREDAIRVALRRFDGEETSSASRPKTERPVWRRPQFAVAFSAMLLVVVGIPAALIGIRSQDAEPERAPLSVQYKPTPKTPAADLPTSTLQSFAEEPPVAPPAQQVAAQGKPAPRLGFAANGQPAAERDAAEIAASPAAAPPLPPPPPPPPPAPAPSMSADVAAQEAGNDIVVSGTRTRQPDRAELAARREAQRSLKARPLMPDYQVFLSTLQRAVRSRDRQEVIDLIDFPLRVNFSSGARVYRDEDAVDRDFDRIFNARVKRAILAQSAQQLFTRDIGAMVGDGELWFDRTSPGQVRIIAVNP